MTVLFQDDARAVAHAVPEGHPERPARIQAVAAALSDERFTALDRRASPVAPRSVLSHGHSDRYLQQLFNIPVAADQPVALDPDTWLSSASIEAALCAVGAASEAVDLVMRGEAANAFCAHRPPGHHAERNRAMGFCLFSTAAIAAKHARAAHGAHRVAIVDFDVHHGNGTEDVVHDDAHILYASSHEGGIFPGTGTLKTERIINEPLPHYADSAAFRAAYERSILPAVDAFAPELIIISAGFDAHADDPLASVQLEVEDFDWVTNRLCEIADDHAGGRVVSMLEGGYDLRALGMSTAAHVSALMKAGKGGA